MNDINNTDNQLPEDQKKKNAEYFISCVDNEARMDCIMRLLDGMKFDVIESIIDNTPENLRNTVNYSVISEFLSFRKKLAFLIFPDLNKEVKNEE